MTVVFGVATILLLPLLSAGIGRTAVAAGAWLLALSPAMVFYSRMFIQESLFAFFTLAFVIAVGRVATGGGNRVVCRGGRRGRTGGGHEGNLGDRAPAALAASAIAWWSLGTRGPGTCWPTAAGRALSSSASPRRPGSPRCSIVVLHRARGNPGAVPRGGIYLDRAIDPAAHAHPWHYYLRLLAYTSSGGVRWSEGLVLVLAAAGAVTAWRRPDRSHPDGCFWARYLTCNAAIGAAIFSAIPYKTPWNLLPVYVGAFALAGIGFAALVQLSGSRAVRGVLAVVLALASLQLGSQAWRAAVTYAADPRNPYVYAQTVPDAVRMATRIRSLSALHRDGARMQVSVIAPPHQQWPLPWYLRTMPNVGYWTEPGDAVALQAPVVVSSIDHTEALDKALGDRVCLGVLRLAAGGARGALCRTRIVGPLSRGHGRQRERAMTPPDLSLVVPCYNEAARLDPDAFVHFMTTHPGVRLVLVDDGSADGTADVLERIRAAAPGAVMTLRHAANQGKGEAVRAGMVAAIAGNPAAVGFIDADLSTPLAAIDDFLAVLRLRPQVEFILGSRVLLMGRDVKRKAWRHYLGRVFATAVSLALDLPVYDTQCGAKVLRLNAATGTLFAAPFRSRWIFDVELIARYLRLPVAAGEPFRRDRLYELVLPAWHDKEGSKLRWYDFAHAMVDLGYIWRNRAPPRGETPRTSRTGRRAADE